MKKYLIENQLIIARQFYESNPAKAAQCFCIVMEKAQELMTEEDYLCYGFALEDLERFSEAKEKYIELIKHFPDSHRGFYALGVIFEALDEPEKAIENYSKALELDPEFYEAAFYMAGVYDDLKQTELAAKYYLKTIEINEDHYFAWLNLGALYESSGNDSEGERCFKKAAGIREHYMAYFNLGVVSVKLGKDDDAIMYYRKSIQLNQNYIYAYLNLSLIYKRLNQFDAAQDELDKAIAVEEKSYLYYHKATVYLKKWTIDKSDVELHLAEAAIKKSLEINPEFIQYIKDDPELKPIEHMFEKR